MSQITVSLKVTHADPVKTFYSTYTVRFWLILQVDNGCRVATGTSEIAYVNITRPSIEEARIAAHSIEQVAQSKVKAMDWTEAMLALPALITDLAKKAQ